ncbi:TPA: transcriptional regulator [Escherichia coli]|uniref:PapB/FocB family fimbrial expression transcriptional regulator n=1 Tax=Escherichia coli TaxID=562 RepID=UPI000B42C55D|nr:PapB/FocB family fimbrial expression transcriptional regulator [Escherichia coli]EEZ6327446.1 transcriptional regulator [Escherichia coli]EHY7589132.1 transcriptional regulator [Escherichia coli]EIK0787085.1 transcriptional regulator [Escherichia coli]EJH7256383.1 transcriptional regulator [Escherichia coli]EJI1742585.1 transcriptional regulator [Escherichia coli]
MDDYVSVCWVEQKIKDGFIPGEMTDTHFNLLVALTTIYSEKVILALRLYLVDGYPRKDACERYNVSPGYFSVCLNRLDRTYRTARVLADYYFQV